MDFLRNNMKWISVAVIVVGAAVIGGFGIYYNLPAPVLEEIHGD